MLLLSSGMPKEISGFGKEELKKSGGPKISRMSKPQIKPLQIGPGRYLLALREAERAIVRIVMMNPTTNPLAIPVKRMLKVPSMLNCGGM
jgi:hypothetical protein